MNGWLPEPDLVIGKSGVMLCRQVRGLTRYRFFPKDGEDLYWYQNRRIEPEVRAWVDILEMQIDVFV